MKKNILFVLIAFLCLGCKDKADENTITIDSYNLEFPPEGGTLSFNITCATDWDILRMYNNDGIELSTQHGTGNQTVNVTLRPNDYSVAKQRLLAIRAANGVTKQLFVSQYAKNGGNKLFQTAFVYEYDDKVWGHDRAFFAEESLYYPYCDCEDRSILLSRLVRDLLGLKVILVYYPGHLATAIHFTNDVRGDYLVLAGINAEKQPLKKTITLPMFAKDTQLTIYADDPKYASDPTVVGNVKQIKQNKKQQVTITIPENGGSLIVGNI